MDMDLIDGNVFLHSLWQGWDENIIIYKQLFDHYRKQWYQYENTIQGKINKIVYVIYAATRYQANVEHVLYVYINNRRVTFVRIVTIMNEFSIMVKQLFVYNDVFISTLPKAM
jgi:uncharacterized membrane protein YesL